MDKRSTYQITGDQRFQVLSSRLQTHIGEHLGSFLLETELALMNKTNSDTLGDKDYDLLLSNLQNNLNSTLGEENTQWLLEESEPPGFGK